MAARFKSKLFVLHVVPPRLSYYPLPAAATPEALQRDQEHQERCREDFDLFITELGDVSVEGRLVEGDAAERIVSFAEENNVDLVMMPTHGYGRRRLLLGSVT